MDKFKRFLKNIAPISENEFATTITFFTEQHLNKGEFFIKQGKVCRNIAFILKGTLRSFYLNNKAEETTACFCTENDFTTSYKSFILQEPSSLTIQAIEDTELLGIDFNNLQKLYHSSPVWQNIGRTILEKE